MIVSHAARARSRFKTGTFVEVVKGNLGSTPAFTWKDGQKQAGILNANATFTFTAPAEACNLMLRLVQDGTGSRTVTWPSSVKWDNGGTAPTLSTAANAIDLISFYFNGTDYFGAFNLNFS